MERGDFIAPAQRESQHASIGETLSIQERGVDRFIAEVGSTQGKIESMKSVTLPSAPEDTKHPLRSKTRSVSRVVFVPDLHIPYQNVQASNTVLNFIKDIKPARVVLMGDVVDFNVVSSYTQDPRGKIDLQEQLDQAGDMLDKVRKAAGPKTPIDYLEGNHEVRMTAYLLRNAQELVFLKKDNQDVLSVPYLLDLKKRGINWHPAYESLIIEDWNVEHGDIASGFSAYSARRMVDKRRVSTIMGHTHRVGMYAFTGYKETVIGIESGSLIDRNSPAASYAKDPNWQTGLVVGEKIGSHFQVTPYIMQQNRFIFNGKLYGPEGVK